MNKKTLTAIAALLGIVLISGCVQEQVLAISQKAGKAKTLFSPSKELF